MSQWVFIEASDVWLFRDNKPFTAQQNFVARGQFPPTPMTTQGAVRTAYLEYALRSEKRSWSDYRDGKVSEAIKQAVGHPGSKTLGALSLRGPFVARRNGTSVERLIRAPLDLLQKSSTHEDEKAPAYRLLTPTNGYDFYTDVPFMGWRPLSGGGEGYKEAHGWLTEAQFENYLRRNVSDLLDLTNDDSVFKIEDRVGLALDYGRRANAEGMFYRAEFIRPCDDVGLVLQTNEKMFPAVSGYINIGGESRSGRYEVLKEGLEPFPQTGKGNVRIVLLTPAYFSGGWQPQDGDWSTWVGGGELVSLVVGKAHPISGWDVANNQPKPLRNYLPTGSVFFFENADVSGIPFTETPPDSPDHGAMGFGTFAVGSW